MISRDKIAGSLYGVALGDALGKPTEFMKIKEIYAYFGRSGAMSLPYPALFTDDTQMTIAVSNAMWYARSITPREMVRTLRIEFIRWMQHDASRAPGITCLTAIGKMAAKPWLQWIEATVSESKGCGANMRVAPTAFMFKSSDAVGLAQLQAAMTHGHPTALAAAELTALAIRFAALDMEPCKLIDRLLAHAIVQGRIGRYRGDWLGRLYNRWDVSAHDAMQYGWRECVQILVKLAKLLEMPTNRCPLDACDALGGGWTAEEALALGLYYAIEYGDHPVTAISEAARTSGDSDSIASIAGAIIGAYVGEGAWPKSWVERIERRQEIEYAIDMSEVSSR